ncbi:MAG: phosphatidylglycerophosphatase A [Desulfuromonadales bacterium]|nr:phosphatidylglycerophosphatase A [Desulfuromonadales bacterium]NIR34381.1 phosphatidylglycerophosphatase A [Desulfuromonadales bacterium]NIS44347.1 phosphatidylglycerophosphatase A [Desulfuromonadales bacterium]
MRRFILLLATNGGLGNAPFASGTVGTLAGIPVFYLMAKLPPALYVAVWVALLLLSFWVATEAGKIYGVVDDGRIVIDELVGYLATVAFVPFSWTAALLGFVFFRLFDISKLPPAHWFDRKMKNGVGVVLDDVVAGVYGAIALYFSLPLVDSLLGGGP